MVEPATYSVKEAADRLGISKTFAYELIETGEFPVPVISLGSRRLISRRALEAYIDPEGSAALERAPAAPYIMTTWTITHRRPLEDGENPRTPPTTEHLLWALEEGRVDVKVEVVED